MVSIKCKQKFYLNKIFLEEGDGINQRTYIHGKIQKHRQQCMDCLSGVGLGSGGQMGKMWGYL